MRETKKINVVIIQMIINPSLHFKELYSHLSLRNPSVITWIAGPVLQAPVQFSYDIFSFKTFVLAQKERLVSRMCPMVAESVCICWFSRWIVKFYELASWIFAGKNSSFYFPCFHKKCKICDLYSILLFFEHHVEYIFAFFRHRNSSICIFIFGVFQACNMSTWDRATGC